MCALTGLECGFLPLVTSEEHVSHISHVPTSHIDRWPASMSVVLDLITRGCHFRKSQKILRNRKGKYSVATTCLKLVLDGLYYFLRRLPCFYDADLPDIDP